MLSEKNYQSLIKYNSIDIIKNIDYEFSYVWLVLQIMTFLND